MRTKVLTHALSSVWFCQMTRTQANEPELLGSGKSNKACVNSSNFVASCAMIVTQSSVKMRQSVQSPGGNATSQPRLTSLTIWTTVQPMSRARFSGRKMTKMRKYFGSERR
ncbi:uncharacterized protein IWZ02DRAFT_459631 [Phyllosticta citriasiana]|uniref:uncharacterized protein n=1 Tax=Phyllosticta citriasiana TaxID=595635 RepID=UPI0030FD9B30